MIDKLKEIEDNFGQIMINLKRGSVKGMYIDYHKPFVKRVWFQHGDYRVYLHRIEPCGESAEALYHPHPWKSAIRIIRGSYEMGIGHSGDNKVPVTDCKLILSTGSMYEMTEPDGWHYVNPIDEPVYSLMVTGERNGRLMPIEPNKTFRPLTQEEYMDIMFKFAGYYKFTYTPAYI